MADDRAHEAVVREIMVGLQARLQLSPAHAQIIAKDIEEIAGDSPERRAHIVAQIEKEIQQAEYSISEQVGSGAFGSVFKGIRRKDNKPVAIKIIDLEESKDDVQTICREITTLVNSSCPQLINYYGSAVFGTKLWIAMEFIDGGSILDKMKKHGKPMTEDQIAYVVHEVLLGLDYLTRNNKIHRDIKAANILLSKSGEVKLADFGATAQLTDTMTKCSTFVGSPYWMAPEVMTEPSYDAKADIWSVGVTCYEMAFGHPPNATIHPLKVTMLIPRLPPPEVGPNFSADFQEFVKACCVKDPNQRPDIPTLLKMNFVAKAPQLQGKLTWD